MTLHLDKPEVVAKREFYETQLGLRIMRRGEFIKEMKTAVETKTSYAAGRIGISEQFWMYYPILLSEECNQTKIRVYEKHLRYHGFSQAGIFPAVPDFYLDYNAFYLERLRTMDCVGLILDQTMGPKIISFHQLTNKLIYFRDLVPDRSSPSNPENCYLPYFKGKKLLLICPFAELLRQRATQVTFEGVWSKTGRKWFSPQSVDALEFPYGFSPETHKKYATAIQLFESIASDIEAREFDIALIAAAGLTIPLASVVKRMGKISVCLGGELQVLFGVIGNRWRNREQWKKKYFNEWWIDMPAKYQPKEQNVCEGAYW